MEAIRIILPAEKPDSMGRFAAVDMAAEQELIRAAPGETMVIPTDAPIEVGMAWVRFGAPAVRLRFVGQPGRTYAVRWLARGFGAGMGVTEMEQDCRT